MAIERFGAIMGPTRTRERLNQIVDTVNTVSSGVEQASRTVGWPGKRNELAAVWECPQGISVEDDFAGYLVTNVRLSVPVAGSGSGLTTVQLYRCRAGNSVEVLSTPVTLAPGEYTSANGVVNAANAGLAAGDILYMSILGVTSTPPYGLCVAVGLRPA